MAISFGRSTTYCNLLQSKLRARTGLFGYRYCIGVAPQFSIAIALISPVRPTMAMLITGDIK